MAKVSIHLLILCLYYSIPNVIGLHSFEWELPPGVTAKDLDMTEVFGITMNRIADLIVIAKPRFPLDHANDNLKN
jgi:hypothetical protein